MADAPATLEEKIGASIDKIDTTPKAEAKTEPVEKAKDDEPEKEEDKKPDAKAEPAEDEEPDKPDEDPEKEKPDPKAEKVEPEEEEGEDDEITPEFKAALSKQRIDFNSLKDLSKKEKSVVLEHVTRINRAFTKAQMEATSFRKEKAVIETEQAYRTKYPERFIADEILKDPARLELVNKELARRENPDYLAALEIRRAAEKTKAEAEASLSVTKADELQERIATLEASTTRAAKAAGLPEEFAQEAVANAILQKRVANEEANLTDAEITDIIEQRTAIFNKHVGAHKAASTREAKNKYVKEKAEDAKNSKPNKPKGASTERKTVPAGAKPENVADFTKKWLNANGM